MAFPTALNGQVTDAVTQTGTLVLGNAPAMAMSTLYTTLSHTLSLLYQNSVSAQNQAAIISQAATNVGVKRLYSTGGMSVAAAAAAQNNQSNTQELLMMLLLALVVRKL